MLKCGWNRPPDLIESVLSSCSSHPVACHMLNKWAGTSHPLCLFLPPLVIFPVSHSLARSLQTHEQRVSRPGEKRPVIYQPELRLLDGDDPAVDAAADAWIQPSAISAASSLALLRFLPSYQNRAATVCPLTTTRLDQAVRPPKIRECR